LPIFAAAAALLVGQRPSYFKRTYYLIHEISLCECLPSQCVFEFSRSSWVFFLFTPCRITKSLATHPFPIHEMGSKQNARDKMNSSRAFRVNPVYLS